MAMSSCTRNRCGVLIAILLDGPCSRTATDTRRRDSDPLGRRLDPLVDCNPSVWIPACGSDGSSGSLGSLYKGLVKDTFQNFKHLRKTRHSHHPVDDARGNAEALLYMKDNLGLKISLD
jgi:hypothetical protein